MVTNGAHALSEGLPEGELPACMGEWRRSDIRSRTVIHGGTSSAGTHRSSVLAIR